MEGRLKLLRSKQFRIPSFELEIYNILKPLWKRRGLFFCILQQTPYLMSRKIDPELYPLIFCFIAAGIVIAILVALFEKRIMPYIKPSYSLKKQGNITIIHITISVGLGIILPNNFLVNYPYFSQLYLENQLMIPISIIVLTILSFVCLGLLLSLFIKQDDKIH